MWRKEFLPALYKYLELKPSQTVVDVGCGTGAFSRLLLNGIISHGKVIGVDRNKRLLSSANRIAKEKGLRNISFKLGRAESLPFPDNFADRVVCQMVLWVMNDSNRRRAIREMMRVCKPGGLVGGVDCVIEKVAYFFPDNKRLTELQDKRQRAEVQGYRRIYGSDKNVGYKLPTLFKELGLQRIRLDGYAYVWLECDDRVPLNFRLKEHVSYIQQFPKREKSAESKEYRKIMSAGGMTSKEIADLRRLNLARSREIVEKPELLNTDTSMNSGLFYIATGVKK